MIKLNDRIWYFDIDAKNNLQTGIVNEIIEESCYHNTFITIYKLDNGKEIRNNCLVYNDEDEAINAYNEQVDHLIHLEDEKIKVHENKIKDLQRKKICTKL